MATSFLLYHNLEYSPENAWRSFQLCMAAFIWLCVENSLQWSPVRLHVVGDLYKNPGYVCHLRSYSSWRVGPFSEPCCSMEKSDCKTVIEEAKHKDWVHPESSWINQRSRVAFQVRVIPFSLKKPNYLWHVSIPIDLCVRDEGDDKKEEEGIDENQSKREYYFWVSENFKRSNWFLRECAPGLKMLPCLCCLIWGWTPYGWLGRGVGKVWRLWKMMIWYWFNPCTGVPINQHVSNQSYRWLNLLSCST